MNSKKRPQIEDVWPQLEKGLVTLLKNLNEGMSPNHWMTLYTLVHDYCATPNMRESTISTHFVGENLYNNLIQRAFRIQRIIINKAEELILM